MTTGMAKSDGILIEEIQERVILAAVQLGDEEGTEQSVDELADLARTAGALVKGRVIQKRERIHPGTYLGKGKIEEVRDMVLALDATGVICDDELSPAQMKNLEHELGCKVMDRTLLILDIFAQRALTSEGKIQVELAQLRYRASRLAGLGASLSRLGGGIGTRGPGEKKLEIDRRLIRERISTLKEELRQVERHRDLLRSGREKGGRKRAALMGFTNSGKSTILNALTGAGVLSEDKLFATLDPTTRAVELEDGQELLLTDTVGFIRKLPHHLVEAFKSTLEEAKYADFLVHVVDAANPQAEVQMAVVYQTLRELGAADKTIVTLFNKQDLLQKDGEAGGISRLPLRDSQADYIVKASAATGEGMKELCVVFGKILSEDLITIERLYPYAQAGKVALIRERGQLLSEEYTPDGIAVTARVPRDVYGQV